MLSRLAAAVSVRAGFVAGTAAMGTAGAGYALSDEGTRRSLQFWYRAMPVYVHYRVAEWWSADLPPAEQDAIFNSLHDRYARTMEDLVLDMRGFYLKLAQIGSTRDEMMPPQYMRWCKRMQDDVPLSFSAEEIRGVVSRSLGKDLSEVFAEWDDKPIGAASIGQVHRARLHDGREVAVKVMYPGIEHKFRSDVSTAKSFCKLAQPAHLPFMNEVEKQFMTEFDYQREAENLEEIRRNILPTWGREVDIPEPYREYCTKELLVMQYLKGRPLLRGIRDKYRTLAKSMGKTLEQLEDEHREKVKMGLLRPASIQTERRNYAIISTYLSVTNFLWNTLRFLYNWPVGHYVVRRPLEYQRTEMPLNLASILDLLLRVHAHQIFVDGCFNGDPHPGNVLLLEDGRIGLIDYGQVKHISPEVRRTYARLVVALAEDNRDEIVSIMTNHCVQTAKNLPDIIYRLACFFHDRDSDDITQGLNIQLFLEEMDRVDPVVKTNDDYVMVGRLSILLRGMGNAFNVKLRTSKAFLPAAQKLLSQMPPGDAVANHESSFSGQCK